MRRRNWAIPAVALLVGAAMLPAAGPVFGGPPGQNVSITSVIPSSGPAAGGTTVTINGSGLHGATEVCFGSNCVTSFQHDSDTELILTSPAGSGTVDVTVYTGHGQATDANAFSYAGSGGGSGQTRSGCFAISPLPSQVGQPVTTTVQDACDSNFAGSALLVDQTGSLTVSGSANTGNLLDFSNGQWQGNVAVGRAAAADRLLVSAVDGANADSGESPPFAVNRDLALAAGAPAYVAISPLYALVPQGETENFTAAAYDQNGQPVSATWSGSCAGQNASTCSFSFSPGGSAGATALTATAGAVSGTGVVVAIPDFSQSVWVSPAAGGPDAGGVAGWGDPLPLVAGQPAQTFSANCHSGQAVCSSAGWEAVLQSVSPGVESPPNQLLFMAGGSSSSLTAPAVSGTPGTSLDYLVEYNGQGAALVRVTSDPRQVLVTVTENGGHPSATALVWANGGDVEPESWEYLP